MGVHLREYWQPMAFGGVIQQTISIRTERVQLFRSLVCEDLLLRPVVFEASESVLNDTETALKTDPACLSCHAVLDPLASALFGFWWIEQFNPLEAARYHPEREPMGVDTLGSFSCLFGEPVSGLSELGEVIANDLTFFSVLQLNSSNSFFAGN